MKNVFLIINADDFGLSRGITDGILAAHTQGILTSTSFMTNQLASDYAVQKARDFPTLDIGIHLNISEGASVLRAGQVRTLVGEDGRFLGHHAMMRQLASGNARIDEIEAEYRAQIRWMRERGITPTHADSHHRLHVYPKAALAFRRALGAEGLTTIRSPRHRTFPNGSPLLGAHSGSPSRRALLTFYTEALDRFVFRSFTRPDDCVSPPLRYSDKLDLLAEGWITMLRGLPPGTHELVCHPGFPDRAYPEDEAFALRRQVELEFLRSEAAIAVVGEFGIRLSTHSGPLNSHPLYKQLTATV